MLHDILPIQGSPHSRLHSTANVYSAKVQKTLP